MKYWVVTDLEGDIQPFVIAAKTEEDAWSILEDNADEEEDVRDIYKIHGPMELLKG